MENETIKVEIKNCNNIISTELTITKNHLNIKYAMNGVGKSSIASIIEQASRDEAISDFRPFGSDSAPKVKFSEPIRKVFLFNENFINTMIFKESEVLPNSFEVFIKTKDYDDKLEMLNNRLKNLKIGIGMNDEIVEMLRVFSEVTSKIGLNLTGESIKKTPFVKSLLSKENVHNVPEELMKFNKFFKHEKYNIDWIDWKNKGSNFDKISGCPFCTEKLAKTYLKEKEIFNKIYKKTSTKHIKDMLEYLDSLSAYINTEKLEVLYACIKSSGDQELTELNLKKFIMELSFIKNKIEKTISFDSFTIKSEEISRLDKYVNSLRIEPKSIDIFNNEKSNEIIGEINSQLDTLLIEIDQLKKELGDLKRAVQGAANKARKDINSFLKQAGINYEIIIKPISQSESTTILKYIINDENSVEVNDIKKHLSWGEKNAFALVLFMHYSVSQEADLIILDDPVSSFDVNKKYAIINRLFRNKGTQKSFYHQTTILLTHDFEPIIDFEINSKPTGGFIVSKFLKNENGILTEHEILSTDIQSVIIQFRENAKDDSLNDIHRIVFLRKYIEHTYENDAAHIAYDILSSLIHGKLKPDKKLGTDAYTDLDLDDEEKGTLFIKLYILNFEYNSVLNSSFTKEKLIELYKETENDYLKLQIFRVYIGISNVRDKFDDDVFLKFIDEVYHVENDYIYYLNLLKFCTIPTYISERANKFMIKEIEELCV